MKKSEFSIFLFSFRTQFIAGVPGTGKTATVYAVVRKLCELLQECPLFSVPPAAAVDATGILFLSLRQGRPTFLDYLPNIIWALNLLKAQIIKIPYLIILLNR